MSTVEHVEHVEHEHAEDGDRVDRIEGAGPIRRGITVWYAVFGGVAAWTIHLVFMASMVRYTCNRPGNHWSLHAATVVCALMTIVAIALAYRLHRAGAGADEGDGRAAGRVEFLAVLGLCVGGINLLLILVEGVYAGVLRPCG